jgi:hypothetical protein
MSKIKKAIAGVMASVILMSLLVVSAGAVSAYTYIGDAMLTFTVTVYQTAANATATLNKQGGIISVSIYGEYIVNGISQPMSTGYGNSGGNSVASATISNGGAQWIYVDGVCTATYQGNSDTLMLVW